MTYCVVAIYPAFSCLLSVSPLVAFQSSFHLPPLICLCIVCFLFLQAIFKPFDFFSSPLKDVLSFKPILLICLAFLASLLFFLQLLVPFLSICAEIFPWQQLGDGENDQIGAKGSVVVKQTGQREMELNAGCGLLLIDALLGQTEQCIKGFTRMWP